MDDDSSLAYYEKASPRLLIEEEANPDPVGPDPSEDAADWINLREHNERRINQARSWRFPWIQHWALIAKYNSPRRSLWLTEGGVDQPVPNGMVRGLPINQEILDTTPVLALRICAAGMMSGLMSPSRPWFKLKAQGIETAHLDRPAQLWLEQVQDIINLVMSESNFYDCAAQMFEDLSAFGTGPMLIYEDDETIINCQNPVVGEYFLMVGSNFRVNGFARLFVMTALQIVEKFGLDNCPTDIRELWRQKGGSLDTERIVAHLIEPNFDVQPPGVDKAVGRIKGDYTFRENYWVWGASSEMPLSIRGFKDLPFISPRWWVTGNDPYGRSPAMDALGDNIQLQVETKRKAEYLEKGIRPPLNVPVELKNQPSSILPGANNYTPDTSKGIKPVYEIAPNWFPAITEDLKEVQGRIKSGYFNDLFLMLAQQTKDMTAFEVAQRQQEKLQVLGPVIERFQNEGAGPAIRRIFSILARKRLLPPMPRSLAMLGRPLQIEYVSMLAMAQKAVQTAGIERILGLAGHMAAVKPTILDNLDFDETFREYSDLLGNSQRIMVPKDIVSKVRALRAKQQAQQQQTALASHMATEVTPALTGAAQDLSTTDVGGGLNALQALMGGQAGGAPALGGSSASR